MKKKVWIALLASGILSYALVMILSSSLIIGCIASVALAALGYTSVVNLLSIREEKVALIEAQQERERLESKKKDEYHKCLLEINGMVREYPYLAPYQNRVIVQFDKFNNKERGLRKIINYNNNKSEAFITSKSDAVREYLERNLKRFVKCMLAYSVTHKKDEEVTNIKALDDILASSQEIIDWYDKLIIEVARMHDNFNEDDADLQSLIENLKQIRMANEGEDDDFGDNPFSGI